MYGTYLCLLCESIIRMDTRFWGPSGWRLLHLIAFAAPSLKQTDLRTFFETLPYVLPCKYCRASLSDYIAVDPIPSRREEYGEWLYRIHNRVNAKLREQKLLETQDPSWTEVKNNYTAWLAAPCTSRRMVGWDFLFSVAYTTPCPSVASSPMNGAPPHSSLKTPELRNRWSVSSREERLKYMAMWWNALPKVLPFQEWRDAWHHAVPPRPSLYKGRRPITIWLYKVEKIMCKALKEDTPHNSFQGLCSELSTFASGCGKRNLKANTCRATKTHARKTLKTRRRSKYVATGGFL
jgi:hypothetical protein